MQPHGHAQPGPPQHGHQLLGRTGLLQQIGGLLHVLAHLLGGVPVVARLHHQKQDLQAVGPPQVVAQGGQLPGELPRARPVPNGHRRKGRPLGQLGGGDQRLPPLFRGGGQVKDRVGGDMEVLPGHPHVLQLLGGAPVPEGDQGRPLHRLSHPAAVGRLAHRADAVGVEHHRLVKQLRPPDDGQVVQQGPGGGPVLEKAPPSRQEGVALPQGPQHLPHLEPGHRLQAAQVFGEGRVIGQDGDGDVVAGRHDPLLNGLENGVVPRVGEAVVAAHHHIEPAAAHLVVHLQAVPRHPAHGVEVKNHLAAVGPQLRLFLRGQGQGGQHVLLQPLRGGHGQAAAAEVARLGLLQLVRAKEALVALVARHDHRLGRRHGLQGGAGHPHKDVPRRHDLVDIGAGAGHHHTGAAKPFIHLVGPGLDLAEHIAAAGNDELHPGDRPVQVGGDLHQLPGHQGPVLVHAAHIGDHRPLGVQAQLGHDLVPGDVRGELVGVDAVDGDGDVPLGHPVLPHQIGLDILGHRHRPLPPVGEVAEHAPGLEHPVGGGDEGELHGRLKGAAQEGGDAGVGVDHVRPLPADDVPEHPPGPPHAPGVPPVHGHRIVADAGGLNLRDIDAPVGGDDNVMALRLQLLGQLHDVGLRPADVQAHGGH